jgi:ribonuclease BN (tRNA processing enzyme)
MMFTVKFRGVRGSYPIAKSEFLQYGGNTSCVEINVGGHLIVLDAGTGLIDVGNELLEKHISSAVEPSERTPINATILLSHIHQDHIQGFTFFGPLHVSSTRINVFGNVNYDESLSDELADLLFGKSFPLDLGDISGNLDICNIDENDAIVLRTGQPPQVAAKDYAPKDDEVVITSYRSYAHPKEGVSIYKIAYRGKTVVYATDKESYLGGDRKLCSFARNCDLLIHDAQYTTEDYLSSFLPKQGYGHSTFDMALECQKQTNAKQLVFFHFDPSYNDEKLDVIKEHYAGVADKATLAYEGLEIEI